jgi:hypothetical protein
MRSDLPLGARRAPAVALAAATLALVLCACGSDGGGDKVASAGSPTGQPSGSASAKKSPGPDNDKEALLRYSRCIRENGVPNFPDPVFNDEGGADISAPDGADPAKIKEAEEKCKQYAPGSGDNKPIDPEIARQNREIAKCMRENGVPNFPDPQPDGTLQIQATPGSGMEPGNPAFEAASKKCNMRGPGGGSTHGTQG